MEINQNKIGVMATSCIYIKSCRIERNGKSRKLMEQRSSSNNSRRWEEMNHEILVLILSKYRWYEWGPRNDFLICKSWLSAFLDVLFPPGGDVLDLRFLEHMPGFVCGVIRKSFKDIWKRFFPHLKRNILRRSQNQYTKIIFPNTTLHVLAYMDITRLLPALKSLVLPPHTSRCDHCLSISYPCFYEYGNNFMFQYLKMLEEAHCGVSVVGQLAYHSNSIRSLTLTVVPGCYNWIHDNVASLIADFFPLLDRLSISSFGLTITGMSMILENHKNLSFLDMRHVVFVPRDVILGRSFFLTPLDYPCPKHLLEKIASVKTVLSCDFNNCSYCIPVQSV